MAGKFEIKAVVTGAQQSADEIKKIGDATQQTGKNIEDLGKAAEKTSGIKGKFVDGLKKARNELPLLAAAAEAVKNPFNLLGLAIGFVAERAIAAYKEIKPLVSSLDNAQAPVTKSGEAFKSAAEGVAAMAAAMKDLQTFTDAVVKGLQTQIEKLDEQFAATEKLLEAEAELNKLKIDRDEKDPVKAAKAKAAIDDELALRKLGMSGKKGQQAAIVEKQIERERDLQIEAGATVPARESLVAGVERLQVAQKTADEAFKVNRRAFAHSEILRRATEDGVDQSEFSAADLEYLNQMGITSANRDTGGLRFNRERASSLLEAQKPVLKLSRERLASARGNLNTTRAALPGGISSMADIDPYIDNANAEAAGIQNQSYGREMNLRSRRDQLLQGQRFDIELQKISVQSTQIRNALGVEQIVKKALEDQAKVIADAIRENAQEIRKANRAINSHSQQP